MAVTKPTLVSSKTEFFQNTGNQTITTSCQSGDLIVFALSNTTISGTTTILNETQGEAKLHLCYKVATTNNQSFTAINSSTGIRVSQLVYRNVPAPVSFDVFTSTKGSSNGGYDPQVTLTIPKPGLMLVATSIDNWATGDTITVPSGFTEELVGVNRFQQVSTRLYDDNKVNHNIVSNFTPYSGTYKDYVTAAVSINVTETRNKNVSLVTHGDSVNWGLVQKNDVVLASCVYIYTSGGNFITPAGWTKAITADNDNRVIFWHRYNNSIPSTIFPSDPSKNFGKVYFSVWRNVESVTAIEDTIGSTTTTIYKANSLCHKGGVQYSHCIGVGGSTGSRFPLDGTSLYSPSAYSLDFNNGYHVISASGYLPSRSFQTPYDNYIIGQSVVFKPVNEYQDFPDGGTEFTGRSTFANTNAFSGGVWIGATTLANVPIKTSGGVWLDSSSTSIVAKRHNPTGGIDFGSSTIASGGYKWTVQGGTELGSKTQYDSGKDVLFNGGIDLGHVTRHTVANGTSFTGLTSYWLIGRTPAVIGANVQLILGNNVSFAGGCSIASMTTTKVDNLQSAFGGTDVGSKTKDNTNSRETPNGGVIAYSVNHGKVSAINNTLGGFLIGANLVDDGGLLVEGSGGIEVASSPTTSHGVTKTTVGGFLIGASLIEDAGATVTGSGGVIIDSSLTTRHGVTKFMSGGIELASSVTEDAGIMYFMQGGTELGSKATNDIYFLTSILGGVELGSKSKSLLATTRSSLGGVEIESGTKSNRIYSDTFSGGGLLGTFFDADAGGVIHGFGGIAIASSIEVSRNYSDNATGGASIAGESPNAKSLLNITSGGVETNGYHFASIGTGFIGGTFFGSDGKDNQVFNQTFIGGAIFGGKVASATVVDEIASGGVLVGGRAKLHFVLVESWLNGVETNGYHFAGIRTSFHGGAVFSGENLGSFSFTIPWEYGVSISGNHRLHMGRIFQGGAIVGNEFDNDYRLSQQCRLRLKKGMVNQDLGFFYVPVFLTMKEPFQEYEFLTLSGDKIPHLVRNGNIASDVRAMVYLRPSPSEDYEFIVRVK